MATVRISPEALHLAKSPIAREAMKLPILGVGWYNGQYPNSLNEDGDVIWVRTGEPGWFSSLNDWAKRDELPTDLLAAAERRCAEMEGLKVLIANEAKSAPGTLTVRVENGSFLLEHSDA